jgi:hypothetical protein
MIREPRLFVEMEGLTLGKLLMTERTLSMTSLQEIWPLATTQNRR